MLIDQISMTILIVCHSYSPLLSPRSFRWSAIAEHWAQQGHRVDVLCGGLRGQCREEELNGVYVHRGNSLDAVVNTRWEADAEKQSASRRRAAGGNNDEEIARSSIPQAGAVATGRLALKKILKWGYSGWRKLYWPDSACLWTLSAVRQGQRLLRERHYDVLVSVSHPFTGHIAGLRLHKYRPALRWIADVGDPFCFLKDTPPNNGRLYKKLNYAADREVFRKSDVVTVTTPLTRAEYSALFPQSATKIHVIPPLLSLPQRTGRKTGSLPQGQAFRIVFIGTLYKHIRSPAFLLRLFQMLLQKDVRQHSAARPSAQKMELHFYGHLNGCEELFAPYRELLGRNIFLHGLVSRTEATQAMQEADLLVNIGNTTPFQLPSKVVEYACTGKPILNIAKVESDSSAAFFETYPAAYCLRETQDGPSAAQVDDFGQFIERARSVDPQTLQQWLAPFRIEAVAAAYETLLKGEDFPA
jgi:glycosyltransferase involved in cell wall biosynthesis